MAMFLSLTYWMPLCVGVAIAVGDDVVLPSQTIQSFIPSDVDSGNVSIVSSSFLPLVECELGDQSEKGLTCNKEGYFISSFEHTVYWNPGDLFPDNRVAVPASSAYCCRMKVPRVLLPSSSSSPTGDALAKSIVSIGCHKSTMTHVHSMQCESEGSSFISGFTGFKSPDTAPELFYPIDSPVCCTPVVKLASGDAWELRRCDCVTSSNIQCGKKGTNRLLWGYEYSGTTEGHHIPLSPALCCKVCLGTKLYDMSGCRDLNHCSDKGVCILGSCNCQTGWTGSDCSVKAGAGADNDTWWQSFWWLGVIGFMCAFTGLFATFWMIQRAEWADRSPSHNGGEESLLQWVDVEGSAGSESTTLSEASSNGSCRSGTVSLEVASVEDAGEDASPHSEQSVEHHGISLPRNAEHIVGRAAASHEDGVPETHDPATVSQEIEAEELAEHENGEANKSTDAMNDGEVLDKPLLFNGEVNPLTGMTCSVCMSHPVQVALVPCGHSNICRRCSRKLQRCPFCRKEIIRRQKLFLSGG